jgi:hypothetical protein
MKNFSLSLFVLLSITFLSCKKEELPQPKHNASYFVDIVIAGTINGHEVNLFRSDYLNTCDTLIIVENDTLDGYDEVHPFDYAEYPCEYFNAKLIGNNSNSNVVVHVNYYKRGEHPVFLGKEEYILIDNISLSLMSLKEYAKSLDNDNTDGTNVSNGNNSGNTGNNSSTQCLGTTQAGNRCKNKTLSPNGYCYLHGGK